MIDGIGNLPIKPRPWLHHPSRAQNGWEWVWRSELIGAWPLWAGDTRDYGPHRHDATRQASSGSGPLVTSDDLGPVYVFTHADEDLLSADGANVNIDGAGSVAVFVCARHIPISSPGGNPDVALFGKGGDFTVLLDVNDYNDVERHPRFVIRTSGYGTALWSNKWDDDEWHTIWGVYDGSAAILEWDAIQVASTSHSGTISSAVSGDLPYLIGIGDQSDETFPGRIACVYFWADWYPSFEQRRQLDRDPFGPFRPQKRRRTTSYFVAGGAAAHVPSGLALLGVGS